MGHPMQALRNGINGRLFSMLCFSLCAIVVLLSLGIWQLDRLEWKRSLIALVEERQGLEVTPLSTLYGLEIISDQSYRRVSVEGVFLNEHSFLLSPRIYSKQSGSHLVTPLRLLDNNVVTVDRGWVPQKYLLEGIGGEEVVSIQATIREPLKQNLFTPDNDLLKDQWYWMDLDAISMKVGVTVLPIVLEQTQVGGKNTFPVRNQTVVSWSNNHLQYALTWFGLAFVFLASSVTYFFKHRT